MNMTECNKSTLEYQGLNQRKVESRFDGGEISSDAGGLLLRELEFRRRIIKRLSECFNDRREKEYIEHSVEALVSQRVCGIALGYEDLNDHEDLRKDWLLATMIGKKDPTGADRKREQDKGKALAGKSTLNRLELTPEKADASKNRYQKIEYEGKKIEELFVEVFLEAYKQEPERIVIDVDTTDDRIHGHQEGRFFHGYYGDYCYLPLYIFCGDHLLCAKLNTADKGASGSAEKELERIIGQIRRRWSNVKITVRGDSHFARDSLMSWCECHDGIDYVFGLAKNNRLNTELAESLKEVKALYEQTQEPQRVYKEFLYQTLNSWSEQRRVIGKAEHLAKGANPRYVVTSLDSPAAEVYEQEYCPRGDMENRIKEQQLYLFADRTSTRTMRANQLRLWFSSIAYILMHELRRFALSGTVFVRAQCHTIREKLFKIGAQVKVSVRRVFVSLASSYPYQEIFEHAYRRLRR
jgi:hypothetical protein